MESEVKVENILYKKNEVLWDNRVAIASQFFLYCPRIDHTLQKSEKGENSKKMSEICRALVSRGGASALQLLLYCHQGIASITP